MRRRCVNLREAEMGSKGLMIDSVTVSMSFSRKTTDFETLLMSF